MNIINGLEIENGVLVRCHSDEAHITIPDGVTSIGAWAFCDCKALVSVRLPESAVLVGKWAFLGCEGLENVTLTGNPVIGHDAFKGCKRLFDENGFLCVGTRLLSFKGSSERALVPATVKSISRKAFFGCAALKEVIIPEGVTEIENGAFIACHALKGVGIPDSVQLFGDEVFIDCPSLESVSCPDSVSEKLSSSKAGYVLRMNSGNK